MQTSDYLEIYNKYINYNNKNVIREELTMLKYFLHNMITLRKEGNTYILQEYSNRTTKYKLEVSKGKIIMINIYYPMNTNNNEREFFIKEENNSVRYTHLLNRSGCVLHIFGEFYYYNDKSTNFKIIINGYDKSSMKTINDYYSDSKLPRLTQFGNIYKEVGIVPDLERIIEKNNNENYTTMVKVGNKGYEYYDSPSRIKTVTSAFDNMDFLSIMNIIDNEDYLSLLENNKAFLFHKMK